MTTEQPSAATGEPGRRPRSGNRRRRRRRGSMETPEYGDMMERMVRRYGVRVGNGDPVDLTRFMEIQKAVFDEAERVAVRGLREAGFTWDEIGEARGTTGKAALMKFREIEPPGVSATSKSA